MTSNMLGRKLLQCNTEHGLSIACDDANAGSNGDDADADDNDDGALRAGGVGHDVRFDPQSPLYSVRSCGGRVRELLIPDEFQKCLRTKSHADTDSNELDSVSTDTGGDEVVAVNEDEDTEVEDVRVVEAELAELQHVEGGADDVRDVTAAAAVDKKNRVELDEIAASKYVR